MVVNGNSRSPNILFCLSHLYLTKVFVTLAVGGLWKPHVAPINALEYVSWRSRYPFSLTYYLLVKYY